MNDKRNFFIPGRGRILKWMCAGMLIGATALSAKSGQEWNLRSHDGTLSEFSGESEKRSDSRLAASPLERQQGGNVTGTVVDASGEPVIGVNVTVKGTTNGTVTDIDGNFSLNVPDNNAVLVFSFIGYATQEMKAGGQRKLRIVLQEDNLQLEEVVVVAFGTVKKKDLTGSVATIDTKLIASQSTSTLTKSLEGAVPGLQVSSVDGQPGMDMAIRIRGLSTANPDYSNPLIVVDGVAYNNVTKSILSTINPKDVESMTVLKDAASTALYGSRGSNGVIMVTTKKGKQGKAVVTFDGKWGVNMAGNNATPQTFDTEGMIGQKYEHAWRSIYNNVRYGSNVQGETFVNNPKMGHADAALFASQHLFDYTGSLENFGRNELGNFLLYKVPGLADGSNLERTGASAMMKNIYLVGTDGKLNPNATLNFHDNWYDEFFKPKFRQEYNINVSGATDKIDYYFSGGYLGDPSYLLGSKFDRYSLRSNINANVTQWLKAGVNMSYSNRKMQTPFTRYGRNGGDVRENLVVWPLEGPTIATLWAYDENGDVKRNPVSGEKMRNDRYGSVWSPFGETSVPYSNLTDWKATGELDKDLQTFNDVNLSTYMEASFLKDFTFRVSLALDKTFLLRDRYRNNETGRYGTTGGALARNQWEYTNLSTLQTLNWAHDFGSHHLDAIAGHEFNSVHQTNLNLVYGRSLIPRMDNFANFITINYIPSGTYGASGGDENLETIEGYLARVNYHYDNRYLLTASVRTDGSSKFRYLEDRWGMFWSFGAAWRVTNEPFAKDLEWLDDLKIRADYGAIGNQNGISAYSGYQMWTYAATSYTGNGPSDVASWSLTQGAAVNPHLTWEKVHTVDVGIDFRFLKRFSATIDWYQKETVDMIWNTPLSTEMGQRNIMNNAAGMRGRGIEVDLNVDLVTNRDWYWSVNLNGAHSESILTKVPTGMGSAELGGKWVTAGEAWSASGGGSNVAGCFLRGEGLPYYNGYIVKYMGVDQETGLPLFSHVVSDADVASGTYSDAKKGDIVPTKYYSQANKVEIGDVSPQLTGGFGTSITYKNLDLGLQFAYQLGGKFFSLNYAYLGVYHNERIGSAVATELWNNTWSPEGDNANLTYANTSAKFPMQFYGNAQSRYLSGTIAGDAFYTDLSLFSASYLNVKNITLGYTLPQNLTHRAGISTVRAYATLDNIWIFTSVPGIDPRMDMAGGFGVNTASYPYMRNASLGLNITF